MIFSPNVDLSSAYLVASSRQRCASPTAPDATGGRVRSNAPIAILKPKPSLPNKFCKRATAAPPGDGSPKRLEDDSKCQESSVVLLVVFQQTPHRESSVQSVALSVWDKKSCVWCEVQKSLPTSAGMTTSSNVMPLVSEHRCPMLIS